MPDATFCQIGGARLALYSHPCVFWEAAQTLFVSDVHLGKTAAFRAGGIPVPDSLFDDLDRLSEAIAAVGARRLVVLGDLVHSQEGLPGSLVEAVQRWRDLHKNVEMALVPGNHDQVDRETITGWHIDILSEVHIEKPFVLCHDPAEAEPYHSQGYVISGHIHPAVTLSGAARQHLRFPCFVFGRSRAILPAFGSFTGNARFRAEPGDRVFVIADSSVVEVGPGL